MQMPAPMNRAVLSDAPTASPTATPRPKHTPIASGKPISQCLFMKSFARRRRSSTTKSYPRPNTRSVAPTTDHAAAFRQSFRQTS